jgi:hypothetical protein
MKDNAKAKLVLLEPWHLFFIWFLTGILINNLLFNDYKQHKKSHKIYNLMFTLNSNMLLRMKPEFPNPPTLTKKVKPIGDLGTIFLIFVTSLAHF